MKLLLIEDDPHKSKQILDYVQATFPFIEITHARAYQSGLKAIITNDFPLILLDMQLPNFEIKSGEDGYKFRKLAGMDILREIVRKKRSCKVVVVTQFETFGEGENYIDLSSLKKILMEQFKGVYYDTIFYGADQSKWQKELEKVLKILTEK